MLEYAPGIVLKVMILLCSKWATFNVVMIYHLIFVTWRIFFTQHPSCLLPNCGYNHAFVFSCWAKNAWRYSISSLDLNHIVLRHRSNWTAHSCLMLVRTVCSQTHTACFANPVLPWRTMNALRGLVSSWYTSCLWCWGSITHLSCSWTTPMAR